ncbi:hypothetical protein [Massilia sp. IC2-476]|uniref:hypothetical protein n=1 Tax=Massilia sp. IC2-476 TaxID=2887199 RepID=UPI001D1047C4|nr:hypothetical protein [Massilia sp. IC2-476]MCC2972367.1 hypothetical protein [Massilia sp. IC2-476]
MGVRIIFRSSVLALLLLASAASAEPVKYSPPDQAFEVVFPAKPECSARNVEVMGRTVVMHVCSYANVEAQLFYSVDFYDGLLVPKHVRSVDLLKGAMIGAAASTNSTIVESHSVEIGGFPALESVMRDRSGLISLSQFVLADQRLFSIHFAGWPNRVPKEAVRVFMESFKINARP